MKQILFAAILLLTVGLYSCSKEDISIPGQNSPAVATGDDAGRALLPVNTNLHIGSFVIDGVDETIHYNLYNFEAGGSQVSATSGLFTINGKWDRSKEHILMLFDVTSLPDVIARLFTNLNCENWIIVNESAGAIYLESYDNKVLRTMRLDIVK